MDEAVGGRSEGVPPQELPGSLDAGLLLKTEEVGDYFDSVPLTFTPLLACSIQL